MTKINKVDGAVMMENRVHTVDRLWQKYKQVTVVSNGIVSHIGKEWDDESK